jgi:hypothetical protein
MNTRAILLAALLVSTAPSLFAGNLTFLSDTPLAALNDKDRELQRQAAFAVLDAENSLASKEWKNSQSGAWGEIRGLGNYRSDDGLHCRKIKIFTEAEHMKYESTFPVCKTSAGEWMFASGKKLTKVS